MKTIKLLILSLFAIGLVACGGSSDTPSASTYDNYSSPGTTVTNPTDITQFKSLVQSNQFAALKNTTMFYQSNGSCTDKKLLGFIPTNSCTWAKWEQKIIDGSAGSYVIDGHMQTDAQVITKLLGIMNGATNVLQTQSPRAYFFYYDTNNDQQWDKYYVIDFKWLLETK